MKKTSVPSLACAVLLAAILAGCSTPHTITAADFVGTWTATKWTETEVASPYTTIDVIAAGGTWTFTILSDGSYTGTVNTPGIGTSPVSGTSTIVDNNNMVVHQGAQIYHISYTLLGNTWTLTHTDGTYDFGSGQQASRQNITAIRS
jgi:hypothetical protein